MFDPQPTVVIHRGIGDSVDNYAVDSGPLVKIAGSFVLFDARASNVRACTSRSAAAVMNAAACSGPTRLLHRPHCLRRAAPRNATRCRSVRRLAPQPRCRRSCRVANIRIARASSASTVCCASGRSRRTSDAASAASASVGGRCAEVAREDVLGGELQETGGDVLDLSPQLPQMTGDRGQRYPGRVQLGCHGQLLGARHEEVVRPSPGIRSSTPELAPPPPPPPRPGVPPNRSSSSAREIRTASSSVHGPSTSATRPSTPPSPRPGVPGLQQLLDGGQGVAAVEEVGDLAQPGQMRVARTRWPGRGARGCGAVRGPGRRGSCGPWRRCGAPDPRSGTRPWLPCARTALPGTSSLASTCDVRWRPEAVASPAPRPPRRAAGDVARYSTALRSEPSCEGWYDRRR